MSRSAVADDSAVNRPIDAAEKLVVALDVESVAEAQQIVTQLGGIVSFFKIGLALQWDENLTGFVKKLLGEGRQVFIDYKYGDIGSSMRAGIAGAARLGVNFLTLQGAGDVGVEDLKLAVSGRQEGGVTKIFLVTVLTSLDQRDLGEIGIQDRLLDRAVRRAEIAHRAGLDGVIASGHEAREIRNATSPEFLIVTPGIRPTGTPHNDQKRVATPHEAVSNGANYLVVGRPIIENPSPAKAAQAIIAEMQEAFDSLR